MDTVLLSGKTDGALYSLQASPAFFHRQINGTAGLEKSHSVTAAGFSVGFSAIVLSTNDHNSNLLLSFLLFSSQSSGEIVAKVGTGEGKPTKNGHPIITAVVIAKLSSPTHWALRQVTLLK